MNHFTRIKKPPFALKRTSFCRYKYKTTQTDNLFENTKKVILAYQIKARKNNMFFKLKTWCGKMKNKHTIYFPSTYVRRAIWDIFVYRYVQFSAQRRRKRTLHRITKNEKIKHRIFFFLFWKMSVRKTCCGAHLLTLEWWAIKIHKTVDFP